MRDVIFKQASPIAKNGFLLYLAQAVLLIIGTGVLTVLFPSVGGGLWTLALEAYAVLIALYAGAVYLRSRSRFSPGMGNHCYALAILGFGLSGILDSWGGYRFLSLGYWLRQAGKDSAPVCGRDSGEVVVFGPESLACPKCSRVVRVGYDVPRGWVRVGLVALVAGVLLYALGYSPAFNLFYVRYAGNALLFDGLAFLLPLYMQRVYFGGYVRLPPTNPPP